MALDKFQPYLFVSAGEQSNKYLTPTIANGIAQFQAQRAQSLTGLTIRINPIQEGTGDPSPDNIRPISGRTGLTVTRAGKNLMCVDNWEVDEDCPITIANGKMTVARGAYQEKKNRYNLPSTDQMTLSFHVKTIALENSLATFKLNADGTPIVPTQGASSSGNIYLVSVGNEADVIATFTGKHYISFGNWAYGGTVEISNIQLEFGSSATSYKPYQGQSIQIPLGQTFYGGTLDVVSGLLTVDWDYIASYDGETLPGEWISDRDVYAEDTSPATGAEVAYKLAEPVTYQLDPEQIKTIPGFNQIYSDAGPVIDIKF